MKSQHFVLLSIFLPIILVVVVFSTVLGAAENTLDHQPQNTEVTTGATGAYIYLADYDLIPADAIASSDGGVFISGITGIVGTRDTPWIVKINSDGNITWKKTISPTNTSPNTLIETVDGDLIVGGYSWNDSQYDAFLMKFDGNGDMLWQKFFMRTDQWGTALPDSFIELEHSGNGNIFAIMRTGTQDELLQLTTDGVVIWRTPFDYSLTSVAATSDGGAIVTSPLYEPIVKVDAQGEVQWERHIIGTPPDAKFPRLTQIKEMTDGNYIATGWIVQDTDNAIWVVKLSGSGDVIWEKVFNGLYSQTGVNVIETSAGKFVVAATQGTYQLLLGLSSSGDLEWQRAYQNLGNAVGGTYIGQYEGTLFPRNGGGFILAGGRGSSQLAVYQVDANGLIPGCENLVQEGTLTAPEHPLVYTQIVTTTKPTAQITLTISNSTLLAEDGTIEKQVLCENTSFGTDTDGDGLLDDWETNGYDFDNDGVIDVNLPAMGADPNKKDIFVEVDWMSDSTHSHKPNPVAIARIVNSYANSPVDGIGINLHVDGGSDSIDYVTGQPWGELSGGNEIAHQDVLGQNQSLADDLNNIINDNFATARIPIFHYSIFAHKWADNGSITCSSGLSLGNSYQFFIVSLGCFENGIGTIDQQAGTFMHELGHDLGLAHGGNDEVNYKPNYLSIMNYSFQMGGLIINRTDGHYDYSRFDLPVLDESQLSEPYGLNGDPEIDNYGTKFHITFPFLCIPDSISNFSFTVAEQANGPVNWDCNVGVDQDPVQEDVNNDGIISTLRSHNDWANLDYTAGGIGSEGTPPPIIITSEALQQIPEEITPEQNALIQRTNKMLYLPIIVNSLK